MEQTVATSSPTLALASFEIEEHVAATNTFFQQSRFTLDDFDVYASPFLKLERVFAAHMAGQLTEKEFLELSKEAEAEYRAIDDRIEANDAG